MPYDAGDWRIPTLTVAPFDATTTATLEIEAPDGTKTTPAATPGDNRGSWSAPAYQLTAGRWIERWTVTGVGAGKERVIVVVAADPTDPIPGAYATVADLNEALGRTPINAARLLVRASRDVDSALLCTVYDITDQAVIAALREAVLEQIAGNLGVGNVTGLGSSRPAGFQLGRLSVQNLSQGGKDSANAPRRIGRLWEQAWSVLQSAGLTGHGPQSG